MLRMSAGSSPDNIENVCSILSCFVWCTLLDSAGQYGPLHHCCLQLLLLQVVQYPIKINLKTKTDEPVYSISNLSVPVPYKCIPVPVVYPIKKLQKCIAGHYRTNPWPAVPDWSRCRNANAGMTRRINGKNNDAGLNFCPAFRYSGISLS
jgi:hypothetical protein